MHVGDTERCHGCIRRNWQSTSHQKPADLVYTHLLQAMFNIFYAGEKQLQTWALHTLQQDKSNTCIYLVNSSLSFRLCNRSRTVWLTKGPASSCKHFYQASHQLKILHHSPRISAALLEQVPTPSTPPHWLAPQWMVLHESTCAYEFCWSSRRATTCRHSHAETGALPRASLHC